MRRARGFIHLLFDAVDETTGLAERTHGKVVRRTVRRFAPIEPVKTPAKIVAAVETAIAEGIFASVRLANGFARFAVNSVARAAEVRLERAAESGDIDWATPIDSRALFSASWCIDHLQSSLNGFWGDYLSDQRSPIDLGMTVRDHGRQVPIAPEAFARAFPNPTNKICVFVHSLAATEWLWSLSSEQHYGAPNVTFGTRLKADLGFTPIYIRYNTGRHISENGRALVELITEVLSAYPVVVDEIVLVGHSMGGLVARSAAHYAREHDAPWLGRLRHVACVGSPHLGAPLEKVVNLMTNALKKLDAAGTQVPAELLDSRSAGIKDLRYGYTVDEEWAGEDPDEVFADARRNVPLVAGVGYYFLAATISHERSHAVGRLLGDMLVRLPSASGKSPEPARRVHFTSGAVFSGMSHLHIANHPSIYEALREFIGADISSDSS